MNTHIGEHEPHSHNRATLAWPRLACTTAGKRVAIGICLVSLVGLQACGGADQEPAQAATEPTPELLQKQWTHNDKESQAAIGLASKEQE